MVVVGAGIGGICAAVAAARAGAKTLLLEAAPALGGTGVHSPVGLICTFADRSGRIINAGLHRELFPEIDEPPPDGLKTYDERVLAERYQRLLAREPRLRTAVNAPVAAVQVANDRIESVLLESGRRIAGHCFVDATADGNLATLAGAQTVHGRAGDQALQPATLTFVVEHIAWERFACGLAPDGPRTWTELARARRELNTPYRRLKARGGTSNPREDVLFFPLPGASRQALFNQTRILGVIPWDPASVERGLREGRRQIEEFEPILRDHPAFAAARIARISSKLGVREGRRVVGDFVLTKEDCLGEARFPDMVAAAGYALDIHNPAGGGTSMQAIPGSGYYHIPYRCLRAAGFANLLLGSRCLSGTHEAHSSYRVMSSISAIGQAAGVAAALAAAGPAADTRRVQAQEIRTVLRKQGQFVEGDSDFAQTAS